MNLENKNELETNDTIKDIPMKLKEKECKDIWKRNCPTCNKELVYDRKYDCDRLKNKNSKCRECHLKNIIVSDETKKKMSESKKGISLTTEHKQKLSKSLKGRLPWNTGKTLSKEHKEKVVKNLIHDYWTGKHITEETKQKIKNSLLGEKNHNFGKHPLDKTRKKMSISQKKKRKQKTAGKPFYNKHACEIFNKIEKLKNWNGIHAEKGGEKYVLNKYYLDYYEPNLNIVIEYDEPQHFNKDGKLIEEDIKRQKEITDHLDCKFYRIKYNENWREIINRI
jgi:hypothetical protein